MKIYAWFGRALYFLLLPLMRLLPPTTRAYVIVLNDQKEVLLVRNWFRHQRWTAPGGGARWGEHSQAAAVREVREETGIPIAVSDLIDLGQIDSVTGEIRAHITGYRTHARGMPRLKGAFRRLEV